jgi:hypothetical protein
MEIVGFWTPDYLRDKLERLRAMPRTPLVLCIDRSLNCSAEELPRHARVVWFRRRIDPAAVLAAVENRIPDPGTQDARVDLGDLFIDWAGQQPDSSPVHDRLAKLSVGDEVCIRKLGETIAIEAGGGPVAQLSRTGCARWSTLVDRVLSARIGRIVQRSASDSAPQWCRSLRRGRWRVPIVEVTLAAPDVEPCP